MTNQTTPCCWCGAIHGAACPRVKALEYYQDGTIKRVEFFTPNDYLSLASYSDIPVFSGIIYAKD